MADARTADRSSKEGAGDAVGTLPPLPRRVTRPRISAIVSWVLGAIVALAIIDFLVTNPNWQWDVIWSYLFSQRILQGLWATIYLTICITVLGLAIGVLVAYCRLSDNTVLRVAASLYIWVIRATPPLVMLLFIFFFAALSPTLGLGIPFGPAFFEVDTNSVITRFSAAVGGLSLYLGGYAGEIYRGGIMAVSKGQYEASKALGMTRLQTMVKVVAPQAVRVIIPPLSNEVITIFKSTSLVVVIGYMELLTTVQQIYARNFQTIPLLVVACIWYLTLTSIAMVGQMQLEKRFGRGFDGRRAAAVAEEYHVPTEGADTTTLAAQGEAKKGRRRRG